MQMIHCAILLGGIEPFMGYDGYVTSPGMYDLKRMLDAIPAVKTSINIWGNWQQEYNGLEAAPATDKRVVIGYSGGGSRATWLANQYPLVTLDLLVTYDASPAWQCKPLGANVKRALCYGNETPFMFGLGGGYLNGPQVEVTVVRQQHLAVQFNMDLHRMTVAAVSKLGG